jgi:hypothetical protein
VLPALSAVRGRFRFHHQNAQVRLHQRERAWSGANAAKTTLVVAPVEARQTLHAIAESKQYPAAGGAGMSLWNLDRGIFKPK